MQNGKPLIVLNNVSKTYGNNVVLNKINLKVNPGEFVSIRGRSGAGKTNLFKILGLLEVPTEGTMQVFERNLDVLSEDEKANLRLRRLGLVFQFFNLLPSLTVMENIELPMALAGIKKPPRQERVRELLGYFGLNGLAERFPDSLSGGERQRVAVIRALVNRPLVLLADEPTSSLDDENSRLVLDMLYRINREEQVTVVVTSTDLYERLPSVNDYLLREGRLQKTK